MDGPASDADVAAYLDRKIAAKERSATLAWLGATLRKVFGTNEVDLVSLNDAPAVLSHRVLSEGWRLMSRDLRATTAREGQALSRYCDWVPQLAKIEASHRRRIEAGEFGK